MLHMVGNRAANAGTGAFVPRVPDNRWSTLLSYRPEDEGLLVLLSLPAGLFARHDAALRRLAGPLDEAAGRPGGAGPDDPDVRYLADAWGFTALPDNGSAQEVADVPHLAVAIGTDGLEVRLSDRTWLAAPAAPPHELRTAAAHAGACLLGVCFDLDLDDPDADQDFWDALAEGRAVLGQVAVLAAGHGTAAATA